MNLIEFCVKRPAFTIVMSLIITVVGLIGYGNLPLRWIPDINFPTVSIYTSYPGASASLVESQITTPLENALTGVEGVDTISSNSKEGSSTINLEFKLGRNINTAVEDVRSAMQRLENGLPTGVKQPTVSKADNANSTPIIFFAFNDKKKTDKEISDYVKQFIYPRMQSLEGVAGVLTYGERESAMHIWLDPMKMASSNVAVSDINRVLTEQNVHVPSGQIRGTSRYYSVITNETLNSATEFNDLILRHDQNNTVRLKDVGLAVVDAANSDSSLRIKNQAALAVGIVPSSKANPLSVAQLAKNEFEKIQKTLPEGMQASIVFDQSAYIESSINHVYESLFEAIFLVLIVIFLFLASWRAALIPIVTIPVCLIGTFAVMNWLGFSINTITLMAFVLAIGLVVDDAIVMLENIMRYIESGLKPFAAAIKGGKEIIFPIIAMTLTLAAVYAPISMTAGILNSIFKEFALTLAITVIISGFVALTLSPMMCSRFLKPQQNSSRYEKWLTSRMETWRESYRHLLAKIMSKRGWVLLGLAVVGALGFFMFKFLPSELAPNEDMNELNVFIAAPRNASFQYTNSYAQQLEEIYKKMSGVESYLTHLGSWAPSRGFQIINMVPPNKREKNTAEIANELGEKVKNFPGVDVYVNPAQSPLAWSAGSDGDNIDMKVMSSVEYKDLHQIMQQMIAAAKKTNVFKRVDSRLKWDGEQFELKLDREKLADMGVSMQDVTNTISTLLAGRNVGHFEYGGNQYDIIMQMNKEALANPNIISQLYVRSANNKMVALSDLITIKETTSPEMFPHYERMRSDTLQASLAPGYTLAEGIATLQAIAKQILPDHTKYSFAGEAKNFLESNGKMGMTFLLALLFIYLILVAQFESFIDPLIILLTVPFAMIGGLVLLKIAGGSLNIYSNIGLVTLIGLISKHGILITEFANRQRALGKSIKDAVIDASAARLRPILMTTAAMVLGALPLALATGSGSETRHQIGWVVVGGLLIGTFFSLIVVPVAYSFLARFRRITVNEPENMVPSET